MAVASVTIDGTKYSVPDTYSDITLNEFLRKHLLITGTKVFCREGGCGACVVYAEFPDPNNAANLIQRSVNSCLCPVLSCDGWSITTVQGIGSQKAPNPIQKTLTDHYGTQCGYCTSGMVMNMYSLAKQYPGKTLTKQMVEDSFDGNICRCTGYRPILEAFKSLAQDGKCENGDIEDLVGKVCKKTGKMCLGQCDNHFDPEVDVLPLPRALEGVPWFQPTSLDDLYKLMQQFAGKKVFYVNGHTSVGVYRDGPYDAQLDLKKIKDLYVKDITNDQLTVGSGVTLTDLTAFFYDTSTLDGFGYLSVLASHIRKIANVPVRNFGTWAGNLMMKHDHPEFPSDVYLCFELALAKLTIATPDGKTAEYSIQDFLKADMRAEQKVILKAVFQKYPGYQFSTYKIMPRSQNAHALVNAGMRAKIDSSTSGKYLFLEQPGFVFGNISSSFFHATQTENYLNSKDIGDANVLQNALKTLQSEIKPDLYPADASPEYRSRLSCALFYKRFLLSAENQVSFQFALQLVATSADPHFQTAVGSLARPISSGVQTFPTNPAEYPLTQPIPKIESMAQCTGEAAYISDQDSQTMLYAAFAVTNQGNATIGSIDTSVASKVPGVVRVLTSADIPGENNFTPVPGVAEELLATKQSLYAGQPVAVVVAASQIVAEAAASAVIVNYTNIKQPILTCQDAIEAKSFYPFYRIIPNLKKEKYRQLRLARWQGSCFMTL